MLIHALRLKPQQDLKKGLTDFVTENKITAAWIMSGLGSLRETNIRYANSPHGKKESGYFEILCMSGTLSTNGCHIHICVADGNGRTTGGHMLEGNLIYTTAEIIIGESKDLVFTREKDGSTEWPELSIKKR